ncbi:MAG: GDSL-type esterase/lipase family protein [Bryobacteraceae bacterium]
MAIPKKAALTMAALAAMMTAPDLLPAFKDYRMLDWTTVPRVLDFQVRMQSDDPVGDEQVRLRPATAPEKADAPALVDTKGDLQRFYAALHATERRDEGAVTRILHYGDSPTTADLITADVRALFQKEFGDAGHGFVLLAKPWAWYGHRGVTVKGVGWRIEPANTAELRDGQFGLGAVSFRGGPGAASRITARDAGHTSFEVAWLSQPEGGSFLVSADGQTVGAIDTASPVVTPSFQTFTVPEGFKEAAIGQVTGQVRLFGVRLLKDGPGVEYSSMGVNGAAITILARNVGEEHWGEQLRHVRPNLVVINYGTNESVYARYVDTAFELELVRVVKRVRKAVPEAAILIMSPMDRGERTVTGEIETVAPLSRLVALEQRVADAYGCAFFNTFEAMGGPGTMGRWYLKEPRMVGADLIHPMPAGARIVGNLLYKSLQDGYRRYKLALAREKFGPAPGGQAPPGSLRQ